MLWCGVGFMNFKVVEGELDTYWDNYEKFIELYNENSIPVKKIKEDLELSPKKYMRYRERAIEENRLNFDTRQPIYTRKNNMGCYYKPKYYSKTKEGRFKVFKMLNGKSVNYGTYSSEDEAKMVVGELKKLDWDKKQLGNIISKLDLKD